MLSFARSCDRGGGLTWIAVIRLKGLLGYLSVKVGPRMVVFGFLGSATVATWLVNKSSLGEEVYCIMDFFWSILF